MTVRVYGQSWAARPGRRVLARVVDGAIAFFFAAIVMWFGPGGRPFAQDMVIVVVVAGFESAFLAKWGATVGKRVMDLRVASFDAAGPVPWLQAIRRSVPIALCYTIPVPGTFTMILMPIVLGVSLALSPFGQAFHERLSDTITVASHAPEVIVRSSLETWFDPSELAVLTPWGRAPDLHERRRARAHRLDNVWWLAAIVVAGTIGAVAFTSSRWNLLWLACGWLVVFCADETWRVSTTGTTPGHAKFGFSIVDITTGEPPSTTRALLRSLVLAPLLYLPPLQLILGLWVRSSRLHRGPHDLIARTVVVERNYVQPLWVPPRERQGPSAYLAPPPWGYLQPVPPLPTPGYRPPLPPPVPPAEPPRPVAGPF